MLYRKDRSGHWKTRGGGLLCSIKNNIMSLRRPDLEQVNDEIMILEVRPNKCKKMALVLCYREPDSDKVIFTQSIQSALSKVAIEFDQFHVIGDFNLPKIDGCRNVNVPPPEMAFCDVVNSFLLTQLNFIPSRNTCDNILDLVFTSSPDRISDIIISSESFPTDHKLLEFSILTKVDRLQKVHREDYNFKKANFDQIRSELSHTNFANVCSAGTVDMAWLSFKEIFTFVLDKYIPKIKIKDSSTPGWIDSEVRHLQNKKYTAWKRAKRTDSEHHWSRFKKLRNRLKNLITAKYDQYIDGFGATLVDNPKRFWSFFRSKTRSKSLPQVISDDNGVAASSPKEKATLFNNYFYSVFTQPKDHLFFPNISTSEHNSLGDIELQTDDVLEILKNLNTTKASGPDGLSPRVLKECAHQIAFPLCHIFNMSLREGALPREWLEANVIPVFKKSDKQYVGNYRPVSLLCICGKVMERAIVNLVFPVVKEKLYHLQHGFIKGRSTVTQLLEVFNEVSSILDNAGQVDMVYLDFSKAFDSVSHKLLLHKLRSFGFHSSLLKWFEAYLIGRRQRVVVDGVNSDWLPVVSGVPQGSILGPLLFVLYINDLPSVAQNTKIALFADDAKCYIDVNSTSDCELLQADLNALVTWSNEWELNFHPSKCQVITMSRRRNPVIFDYNMDGTSLSKIDTMKDLGVDISSKLVWDTHVNRVVKKCNRKMGMIMRTVGFNAPVKVTKTLYSSLIRSDLEYGSCLWSGTSKHNIQVLEGVQRRATKFILHYPDQDYKERLSSLDLLPLSLRRENLICSLFIDVKRVTMI